MAPWEMSKWVRNFDEYFYFNKNFLCSLIQCAHVLQHLKTVKRFHNRISINYRQVKDSSMGWDFFKCPWKMWILSQKFRWKMFFSSNFFWYPLQCKQVLDHPENVESFHSCISSGKQHLRVSTCDSAFSKTSKFSRPLCDAKYV